MSQIDRIYGAMRDDTEAQRGPREQSQICQRFENKTLFVTGATGFMGKCLLEKLLRSVPVKHLYILMRERKTGTLEDQANKYFKHVIFDVLRRENPNFREKVTVIKGDLISDGLGLSREDRNTIVRDVDIMYHNAANVKFDIRISLSLKINVLGTLKMLELARECKKLSIFIYISTAYSHCYRKKIEEEFYHSPADLKAVYDAIKADEGTPNGLTEAALKTLLGNHPNIYTYTKSIAEDLVRQHSKDCAFAVAIYRPSIVISAYKEPLPGWVGNSNGPVNIILGAGLGMIHTAYHHGHPLDFVPSDYTINALLAITWDVPTRWQREQGDAIIYNYSSSTTNPTTLPQLYDYMKYEWREASPKTVWVNAMYFTSSKLLFFILHLLFHFIPACFLDLFLIIIGKKPIAVSIFMKVTQNLDKIDYFGNGNWRIYMPKTIEVMNKMNSTDRELFCCDIRELKWQHYVWVMWRGLRVYFLKEDLNSDAGVRRYTQIWYIHYAVLTMFFVLFCYVVVMPLIKLCIQ
ncbi:fatty acyl-CoA reductase wat-like [Phymastichus coffea]|uniref:fatty acyl-CoA reductase wat-like n=1 Tax=Phymastichus coffea TaxID=108790 RepID=UPI00273BB0D2|nr:fatty acyl-CoA reductase wat-like [Phymastichus coffea]